MKLNERAIARNFFKQILTENLDQLIGTCSQCGQSPCRCVELCGVCRCNPCECPGHYDDQCVDHMLTGSHSHDQEHDHHHSGESHSPLELDARGAVTPDSLYSHFDLDNDGVVTPQEYKDHVSFHAAYPETLDHYNSLRSQSHASVPCKDSYDSCSQFFMADPESIQTILSPLMSMTSTSCPESAMSGIIDVIKCLKKEGLL